MLSLTDAAYLAGILDGEGTFSVNKMKGTQYNSYGSEISVGTTTPVLTDWLQALLPGQAVYGQPVTGNRDPVYRWVVGRKETLLWVLPQVIPFLVVKKLHAQLLLKYCQEFSAQIPGVKLSTEDVLVKDTYCQMFTMLNARGAGAVEAKLKVVARFASGEIDLPGGGA